MSYLRARDTGALIFCIYDPDLTHEGAQQWLKRATKDGKTEPPGTVRYGSTTSIRCTSGRVSSCVCTKALTHIASSSDGSI